MNSLHFKNLPIKFYLVLLKMNSLAATLFLDHFLTEIPSNVLMMEDPAVGLTLSLTKEVRFEKRTLHVFWSKREAKLFYTIYSTDPSEEGEWVQSSPDKSEQITKFWEKLNFFLADAIPRGSPSEQRWEGICLNLQGIGQSLFNRLIPSQVAERIQKWESGFSVRVSTNEQWIPWELMYDGQKFLGDKFIFTRYPRLKDRKAYPDKNRPKYQRAKQVKKIVNVVGGNIEKPEAQRASELFTKLSESVPIKLIREESISKLTKAVAQADILHFTCHGHLEPLNLLQISSDDSPIDNLCLDTVQQLPLKPGSLIFANTCTSTVPVQAFSEFSSFGWEFYRQGADVFIGTLGIVPTKYAISFAENVYEELLCKDTKLTIGQAVANAKKTAAEKQNFFWLLYCIYGNPDVYFKAIE